MLWIDDQNTASFTPIESNGIENDRSRTEDFRSFGLRHFIGRTSTIPGKICTFAQLRWRRSIGQGLGNADISLAAMSAHANQHTVPWIQTIRDSCDRTPHSDPDKALSRPWSRSISLASPNGISLGQNVFWVWTSECWGLGTAGAIRESDLEQPVDHSDRVVDPN